MIDPPQVVHTSEQSMALIHVTTPRSEVRNVMGPSLQELTAEVQRQGIAVTGPWFTHHLRIEPEIFDFEICLPVASPVTAAGRVVPGRWPEMTVVRTVYHGPYEGLPTAWGEFESWIKSQGHATSIDLWERYLVGPESSTDPGAWRTEMNRQLLQ